MIKHPKVSQVKAFNNQVYGINSTIVFIDVSGSTSEKNPTTSYTRNYDHTGVVSNAISSLLGPGGRFKPAQLSLTF